jgi:hypothetical protein
LVLDSNLFSIWHNVVINLLKSSNCSRITITCTRNFIKIFYIFSF